MFTNALVLFSGGQDSTTCLAWALDRFERVETIGFDYGQRHRVELDARLVVLDQLRRQFPQWGGKLGQDHVLDLAVLGQISESSLTRETSIGMESSGLPSTFVPGRNLVFLTLAAALAYRRGLQVLVTGVCETDFSGYPDCRDDTMKAMQLALSLGMDRRFLVETPLMWVDKARTWALASRLGGRALVELIVEQTHTCYLGDRSRRHVWGYGCGSCPACVLRARGFTQYLERPDVPSPGDGSRNAPTLSPGDGSRNAPAPVPGDGSRNAPTLSPGPGSRNAPAPAPGDGSRNAPAPAPGDGS